MSTHKSIVKSFSRVSFFTLCSRILGFARDIVIARFFGTSDAISCFFVAFRVPNLLRDVIGEGAASSALVPVFSEYSVKSKRDSYINLVISVFCVSFIVLIILVVLGVILSPLIVRLIAPGFMSDPNKLNLTIYLLKITFPYIFFMGLVAMFMAFLNTEGIFSISAFSPCLLNISMIVAVYLTFKKFEQPIVGVAYGVLAGGFLQLLIHIIPSIKKAFFFDGSFKAGIHFNLFHPALKKIFSLLIPRVIGTVVYQLNVFIDTIIASLSWIVGEGAVAAIYYSNHLIQFPLGVFSTALTTAILPSLSKKAASGDMLEHKSTIIFSLKAIFFIMIPSGIALFVLAHPIIQVLFQRGEFTSYSTNITSVALLFYALGLPFYAASRILASGFYSHHDTTTPVKIAFLCLFINLALNLILMWPLKVGGLALASSISSFFNFFILNKMFKQKIGIIFEDNLRRFIIKVCLSSLILGIFLFVFWKFTDISILPKLIISVICGVALYIGITHLLGIKKTGQIITWMLKN